MKWRNLFGAGILLVLAACAGDPTPTQEAGNLLETYKAIAKPALKCVQTPACDEKVGDEVRAADAVAFEYTESVTEAAIAWEEAPEDAKPDKLTVFEKVLLLGRAAVEELAASF